jgi:hypothetical protein
MPDDSLTIAALLVKAETHAVDVGPQCELPGVHELRRLWSQDLRAFVLPILKMGNHEVSHIHGGD